MVFVSIQGKDISGKHESALDGKIISGESQETNISNMLDFLSKHKINANKQDVYEEIEGKFFCTLLNKERDFAGCMRLAMVLGDKGADKNTIRKTLELMNLSYEEFKALHEEYHNPKKSSKDPKKFYIIMGAVIVILLLILIIK